MTKLHETTRLGQAIWLDYIHRSLITSGELRKFVDQGLRGVTSNPSIFEKAITGSGDYDEDMSHQVDKGESAEQIYETLAIDDIRGATDALRPLYEEANRADGYVSLEVNPSLAHDTKGTIAEARRLFTLVDRPNVMIKVPATPAGIPAIEQLIGEGVNVNVTLIFSLNHYEAVAAAYIAGLEKLAAAGGDLGRVASVASFFISRVDTTVDAALERIGNTELQGKIGIDNAKIAYARFQEIFSGERWQQLAAQSARVQRPLWASTGTKNPAYPDTLYVDNLIGPDTVNTLPPDTLDAFLSHGKVSATVEKNLPGARGRLAKLAELGIDLGGITERLQDDGVAAFGKSFDSLIASIAEKREKLLAERQHFSAGVVS